jgi:hypothetical protein
MALLVHVLFPNLVLDVGACYFFHLSLCVQIVYYCYITFFLSLLVCYTVYALSQ